MTLNTEEIDVLLESKTAIIYGGGGAIGSAAARAFAREGARLFLVGRSRANLDEVATELTAEGCAVDVAQVDALDEAALAHHAQDVLARAGRIDVVLNAVGIPHVQGTPLDDLTVEDYLAPIAAYVRTNFLTTKAVAPQMVRQGSGVILTLSTPGSRLAGQGFLGYGVTCAAIEAFTRILAGELGPSGIRTICLRADMIPDSLDRSHVREVFEGVAGSAGLSVEDLVAGRASTATLLGRLPTLDEVGAFAAFAASERAGAMTGAIANLTCGSIVD